MRKARAVAPIRITPKQAFWRTGMLAGGKTHEEIAAASARRYELRPRTAFRHAHDWTFLATVAHINAVAIGLGYQRRRDRPRRRRRGNAVHYSQSLA